MDLRSWTPKTPTPHQIDDSACPLATDKEGESDYEPVLQRAALRRQGSCSIQQVQHCVHLNLLDYTHTLLSMKTRYRDNIDLVRFGKTTKRNDMQLSFREEQISGLCRHTFESLYILSEIYQPLLSFFITTAEEHT